MRVNILCYEPKGGWILRDYSDRLQQALEQLGVTCEVADEQRDNFDVTYHVNYAGLRQITTSGLHCTNVTHIDEPWKLDLITEHKEMGVHGICCSEDTARRLRGVLSSKNFIGIRLPAMLAPLRKQVSVLISSSCYPDGRKNETWVGDFCRAFSPDILQMTIMGRDWEKIVEDLQASEYRVEYIPRFERTKYLGLLKSTDYLLYTGFDEGAVSVADAVATGVAAIASAQGFHLDLSEDLILFSGREDLARIAKSIADDTAAKNARAAKAADWVGYAQAHIDYWDRLIRPISSTPPSTVRSPRFMDRLLGRKVEITP